MRTRPLTLITGGAGFIGTNLADRLMSDGHHVLVFDNLSRPGVERNLEWLADRHPERFSVQLGDVRDAEAVAAVVDQASEIYHLAAQVAVTSSLSDPVQDFEVNAHGTLNVLEAMRRLPDPPPLVFTSTNKVYGALEDIKLRASKGRYVPTDAEVSAQGIDEQRPLDFHSPYGCSKGAAEQYVRDYARCFGLHTVVFRMSCIYGPHQRGNEDQGWVAHFLLRAQSGSTLRIFGDGLQVRDVLYVEDLVDGFERAMRASQTLAGKVFNIGGGPDNTLSLLELVAYIKERHGGTPLVSHSQPRIGDQRYYVSNTRAFEVATGWQARTPMAMGLQKLSEWIEASGHGAPLSSGELAVAR
jgi:CDP-paratose 2-epimerase